MKLLHRCVAAVACMAAVSAASAAAVTVKFDNNIFEGSGSDAVQIKYRDWSVTTATAFKSQTVAAGRFQGTVTQFNGVPESIFVDGLSNLYAYCFDIYESIQGGQTVNYSLNFDSVFARTLDFLGAVNSVLSVGGEYDEYAWLSPANANIGAAIQIGLWESKYDESGWSLGLGNFRASSLESATTTYYNSFVSAMAASGSLDKKYVMVMEAAGAQDMIVGDPPVEVPEPSSLLLVGGALLALVGAHRRSRRPARH